MWRSSQFPILLGLYNPQKYCKCKTAVPDENYTTLYLNATGVTVTNNCYNII